MGGAGERIEINPDCTYRTRFGKFVYIHDVSGEKVTFCQVGSVDRIEASLNRLRSILREQVPNQ